MSISTVVANISYICMLLELQ